MVKSSQDINLMNKLYSQVPAFTDIFDEETFYAFAVCVVLGTLVLAFILSRFVTIKAVE